MLSAVLYYWTACRLYHTPLLSDTALITDSARISLFGTFGVFFSSGVARCFLSRARREVFQALGVIRSLLQFLLPSCDSSQRKYVKKRA